MRQKRGSRRGDGRVGHDRARLRVRTDRSAQRRDKRYELGWSGRAHLRWGAGVGPSSTCAGWSSRSTGSWAYWGNRSSWCGSSWRWTLCGGAEGVFDSNGSAIAKVGLERIAQIYRIEDRVQGEMPATRQFVRCTESAPLVNAFGVWLDEQRSRVSPPSRLGEKLTYIANR